MPWRSRYHRRRILFPRRPPGGFLREWCRLELASREQQEIPEEVRRSAAIPWLGLASAIRELAIFAGFVLLAVVLTWPMGSQLATIVSDNGDPLLNAWILDWDCFALVRHPLSVFQAPMFYPARYPLAYSENLLGIALVVLPLSLMHVSPLTIYNIAMLLGFAFSAYGAAVLARLATRSTLAATVAGILYGFVQFRFDHLAHLQMTWGGWLPLIAAALLFFRSSPSLGRAALLCGALIMNGLTNVHWLLFGFVAFSATLLL